MERKIHNLKGSAGTYGFPTVTLIAHRLEDYIEATRRLRDEELRDVQVFVDIMRGILESTDDPQGAERDAVLRRLPSNSRPSEKNERLKETRVLLVMPKGLQRKLVGGELAACGVQLSFAEEPVQAISLAVAIEPAIIVSNMEFDRISGAELARVFQDIGRTRNIPFVLLTSHEVHSEALTEIPEEVEIIHKETDFAQHLRDYLDRLDIVPSR